MTRVEEIIRLETDADRLARDYEANRWETARLIAAELDDGKTQRQLAAEIGKSQKHVDYMARTWRLSENLGSQDRPTFNDAYHSSEVRGTPAIRSQHPSADDAPAGSTEPSRDQFAPPLDVRPHDTARETAESPYGQKAERPLFEYGPREALAEWLETFARILADMARLAQTDGEKKQLRDQLHEMIDRDFQ
jgi:hypothetical protein